MVSFFKNAAVRWTTILSILDTVASSRVSRVSINLWINTAISKRSSANIAMYSSESNFPVPLARLYDHPNRHEIAMLPIKITTASMRTHVY